jgi:hypothetical protein
MRDATDDRVGIPATCPRCGAETNSDGPFNAEPGDSDYFVVYCTRCGWSAASDARITDFDRWCAEGWKRGWVSRIAGHEANSNMPASELNEWCKAHSEGSWCCADHPSVMRLNDIG